jgi:hypothetical protein
MLVDDSVYKAYLESLNMWHLELAITASALKNLSLSHDVDNLGEPLADLVYILQHRFDDLVESCPFPSFTESSVIALGVSHG